MPAQDLLNAVNTAFATLSKLSPSAIVEELTVTRIGAWTSSGEASLKLSSESSVGQIKIDELVQLLSNHPYALKKSSTFSSNDYTYSVSQKSSMFSSPGSTLTITASGLRKIDNALTELLISETKTVKSSSSTSSDHPFLSSSALMMSKGGMKPSTIAKLEVTSNTVSPWLDSYIEDNELDEVITECSCCDAYDSSKPENGRSKISKDIVELAEGKKDITLMMIGPGNMKPTLSTCEQLLSKGHNVNLILIEPRLIHEGNRFPKGHPAYKLILGGYDELKAKISDEQLREFFKAADEMSRAFEKSCKIVGTFPTLSSYYVHTEASKRTVKASTLAEEFISKYHGDREYKSFSDQGDYFGEDGDFESSISDSINGGRFILDSKSPPPTPDIICASDMGPHGKEGQALTEGCRDFAEYIVQNIYMHSPSSVVSWKIEDGYENPKTELAHVVKRGEAKLDDSVSMDDSLLMSCV